jgi:hypothetical protein
VAAGKALVMLGTGSQDCIVYAPADMGRGSRSPVAVTDAACIVTPTTPTTPKNLRAIAKIPVESLRRHPKRSVPDGPGAEFNGCVAVAAPEGFPVGGEARRDNVRRAPEPGPATLPSSTARARLSASAGSNASHRRRQPTVVRSWPGATTGQQCPDNDSGQGRARPP